MKFKPNWAKSLISLVLGAIIGYYFFNIFPHGYGSCDPLTGRCIDGIALTTFPFYASSVVIVVYIIWSWVQK